MNMIPRVEIRGTSSKWVPAVRWSSSDTQSGRNTNPWPPADRHSPKKLGQRNKGEGWQKSCKTPHWSFRLSAPSIPIKPTDQHLSLHLVGEQAHRDSICCCPPTGTPAQSHSMATSLWNLHQSVTLSELLCRKPFALSTRHTPLLSFQIQLSNKLSQTSPIFFQRKARTSFAFVSCHPTNSSR